MNWSFGALVFNCSKQYYNISPGGVFSEKLESAKSLRSGLLWPLDSPVGSWASAMVVDGAAGRLQ